MAPTVWEKILSNSGNDYVLRAKPKGKRENMQCVLCLYFISKEDQLKDQRKKVTRCLHLRSQV